ncbi:MAG TPA: hypothetical protein VMF68_08390 [Spirochaetia bacterium]|nr:hypothetical protein [Spirochaetia bacterium]
MRNKIPKPAHGGTGSRSPAAPIVALILFVIAARGGFTLFGIDLATQKPPKWRGVVHGLVAVAGFVFLLVFALAGGGST